MEKINADSNLDFDGGDADVFYAELRKQILILTADDDDEDFREIESGNKRGTMNKSTAAGFSSSAAAVRPGNYFDWSEKENDCSAPIWLMNLWRNNGNGNGTGVFIPYIVKSRRNFPGKSGRHRGKFYKRVEKYVIKENNVVR